MIHVGCKDQAKNKLDTTIISPDIKSYQISDSQHGVTTNLYVNDKKDGMWRTYYENGQIKSEGHYIAGLKEGLHKEWKEDGILSLEGNYINDKANGLMTWYHDKGHLAGRGQMVDDKRIGNWKICDIEENGYCVDAYFEDGLREGIWKIYHDNEALWKEQTFKNDRIISEKCWNKNGKEIECN
jgi:antitoxin component YwqK of YwqJK toxin-antitoxin module